MVCAVWYQEGSELIFRDLVPLCYFRWMSLWPLDILSPFHRSRLAAAQATNGGEVLQNCAHGTRGRMNARSVWSQSGPTIGALHCRVQVILRSVTGPGLVLQLVCYIAEDKSFYGPQLVLVWPMAQDLSYMESATTILTSAVEYLALPRET